jgi:hypothetical protein
MFNVQNVEVYSITCPPLIEMLMNLFFISIEKCGKYSH